MKTSQLLAAVLLLLSSASFGSAQEKMRYEIEGDLSDLFVSGEVVIFLQKTEEEKRKIG